MTPQPSLPLLTAPADGTQPRGPLAAVGRYAWWVVLLLWPVAMLNYLDRQLMASMKFSITHDVPGIGSEQNWGTLLATFKWVYAGLSPLGGYLADRFSRKWVIVVSLAVWSAVTLLTGHAHTYHGLLLARALMGVSEACYVPAALALLSDFHAGRTRSRAVGIHQTAIPVGVIVGGFSGYMADAPDLGWRAAFYIAGGAGIAYVLPLVLLLRDSPRAASEDGARRSPLWASARELLTNVSFLLLVLYFTLPALAGWVVRDWMPAILKQQFNLGQGVAGVSATLYVNAATVVGMVLGGVLADRWMRWTVRGRIYVSAIGTALLIPSLFGVGDASTLIVAIAFLAVFGLGWGLFDCNSMPILCQVVRPRQRATAYGVMNLVSISCGGFADRGFGTLRDNGVALNAIFAAFAGLCVLSVALVLMIRPRGDSVEAVPAAH
jgi:MFS family permease